MNKSVPTATTSATASPGEQSPRAIESIIKAALDMLPYWPFFLAIVIVASGVAFYFAKQFASTTYNVGAAMIYHPLPIDQSAERLYSPPDLRTLTSLVNSAPVLERAIAASGEPLPPRLLAKNLVVFEPRSTQRIGLLLATADREQGKRTLSEICRAAQDCIAEIRREVVGQTLSDVQRALERSNKRLKAGREELLRFTGRLEVADVDTELQDLASELSLLEFKLNTSQIEEQGLRVQYGIVSDQLKQHKQREQEEASAAEDADAAQESLTDARRRQDRLNELIREERRLNEVRAKLDAKQNVFDRKLKLYEKGYISRGEFEEIESLVKELQAQIMEGPKIAEWRTELDRIDKTVVPTAGKKQVASPLINQTMFKLFELDLLVNNAQETQRQTGFKLVELRRRREQLRQFQQDQSGLQMEIESATNEHDMLSRQISALTSLSEMAPLELTVAEAPSSAMQVESSNFKKLFAIAFAVVAAILSAPLLLLSLLRALQSTLLDHGQRCGLTLLSPRPSFWESIWDRRTIADANWERQIALRIQQLMPRSGSVVSIVPASVQPQDDEMLQKLAGILQHREETVLVLRLGNPPATKERSEGQKLLESLSQKYGKELPTLADYLTQPDISIADTVGVSVAGINVVHGGDYDPELLFSQRMTAFFRFASECYSTVLVYGMDLQETTTVEMLARHSDGIILLHDNTDLVTEDADRTMENLTEIGAPIFGMATRPRPLKESWLALGRPKSTVNALKTTSRIPSAGKAPASAGSQKTSGSNTEPQVRAEQESLS